MRVKKGAVASKDRWETATKARLVTNICHDVIVRRNRACRSLGPVLTALVARMSGLSLTFIEFDREVKGGSGISHLR